MIFTLYHLSEVTSTNDYLKVHYQKMDEFSVVRADYQIMGRGQFLRQWQSLRNLNLLFSFLVKNGLNEKVVRCYEKLVLQVLISVLNEYDIEAHVKLPNDIYVNNKKISGILIETKQTASHYDYLIVGIGLNVLQNEFSQLLNATSMVIESVKKIDLEEIFSKILKKLERQIEDGLSFC